MNFSGGGTQPVIDVWVLGDPACSSCAAWWETLKVLSANELETSRDAGAFSIDCER